MLCRLGASDDSRPGAGDRLIERRPDAVAGADCGEQTLAVGRAQLFDLAVVEEVLDDRMLAAQLLELSCIGGIAGLGLLLPGETEPVEENLAELLGRVDVEIEAGVLDDEQSKPIALGDEVLAQGGELGDVDTDADDLHLGQHPDERHLDLVVERAQRLRVERRLHRLDQAVDRKRVPADSLRAIDRVVAERQLARRRLRCRRSATRNVRT